MRGARPSSKGTQRRASDMAASGGMLSRRAAAVSDDGRLVLTPAGSVVRVYSALTGEHVGSLEGHEGEVTCVQLNPRDAAQVRRRQARGSGAARPWTLLGPIADAGRPARSISRRAPPAADRACPALASRPLLQGEPDQLDISPHSPLVSTALDENGWVCGEQTGMGGASERRGGHVRLSLHCYYARLVGQPPA